MLRAGKKNGIQTLYYKSGKVYLQLEYQYDRMIAWGAWNEKGESIRKQKKDIPVVVDEDM